MRPRLHQALGAAEFAELQRTGSGEAWLLPSLCNICHWRGGATSQYLAFRGSEGEQEGGADVGTRGSGVEMQECAELLDFASRANFPDVRRLDGEAQDPIDRTAVNRPAHTKAGRGGAYHFCKGSPPPLVEAIRTSLYAALLTS